jgi:hypothetical protein
MQDEGDLMYLPAGWNHATINVGETLAFATQINRLRHRADSRTAERVAGNTWRVEGAPEGLGVNHGSRQEMLATIEAAGPSSREGLALLRELRAREPGNVDTVARLVSALVNRHRVAHKTTTSSKRGKKQQINIERKAAVKEVNEAILEVNRMLRVESADGIFAGTVVDDWAAMQVRCCALLSDLAQYKAAKNCLDDVEAAISSGSTPNARLHFELARAALRSIERAMRRGEEVFQSQVEPIAQQVGLTLAIDSQHKGAMEFERVLAASPPTGLGWVNGGRVK